jgi:hypothetical protein
MVLALDAAQGHGFSGLRSKASSRLKTDMATSPGEGTRTGSFALPSLGSKGSRTKQSSQRAERADVEQARHFSGGLSPGDASSPPLLAEAASGRFSWETPHWSSEPQFDQRIPASAPVSPVSLQGTRQQPSPAWVGRPATKTGLGTFEATEYVSLHTSEHRGASVSDLPARFPNLPPSVRHETCLQSGSAKTTFQAPAVASAAQASLRDDPDHDQEPEDIEISLGCSSLMVAMIRDLLEPEDVVLPPASVTNRQHSPNLTSHTEDMERVSESLLDRGWHYDRAVSPSPRYAFGRDIPSLPSSTLRHSRQERTEPGEGNHGPESSSRHRAGPFSSRPSGTRRAGLSRERRPADQALRHTNSSLPSETGTPFVPTTSAASSTSISEKAQAGLAKKKARGLCRFWPNCYRGESRCRFFHPADEEDAYKYLVWWLTNYPENRSELEFSSLLPTLQQRLSPFWKQQQQHQRQQQEEQMQTLDNPSPSPSTSAPVDCLGASLMSTPLAASAPFKCHWSHGNDAATMQVEDWGWRRRKVPELPSTDDSDVRGALFRTGESESRDRLHLADVATLLPPMLHGQCVDRIPALGKDHSQASNSASLAASSPRIRSSHAAAEQNTPSLQLPLSIVTDTPCIPVDERERFSACTPGPWSSLQNISLGTFTQRSSWESLVKPVATTQVSRQTILTPVSASSDRISDAEQVSRCPVSTRPFWDQTCLPKPSVARANASPAGLRQPAVHRSAAAAVLSSPGVERSSAHSVAPENSPQVPLMLQGATSAVQPTVSQRLVRSENGQSGETVSTQCTNATTQLSSAKHESATTNHNARSDTRYTIPATVSASDAIQSETASANETAAGTATASVPTMDAVEAEEAKGSTSEAGAYRTRPAASSSPHRSVTTPGTSACSGSCNASQEPIAADAHWRRIPATNAPPSTSISLSSSSSSSLSAADASSSPGLHSVSRTRAQTRGHGAPCPVHEILSGSSEFVPAGAISPAPACNVTERALIMSAAVRAPRRSTWKLLSCLRLACSAGRLWRPRTAAPRSWLRRALHCRYTSALASLWYPAKCFIRILSQFRLQHDASGIRWVAIPQRLRSASLGTRWRRSSRRRLLQRFSQMFFSLDTGFLALYAILLPRLGRHILHQHLAMVRARALQQSAASLVVESALVEHQPSMPIGLWILHITWHFFVLSCLLGGNWPPEQLTWADHGLIEWTAVVSNVLVLVTTVYSFAHGWNDVPYPRCFQWIEIDATSSIISAYVLAAFQSRTSASRTVARSRQHGNEASGRLRRLRISPRLVIGENGFLKRQPVPKPWPVWTEPLFWLSLLVQIVLAQWPGLGATYRTAVLLFIVLLTLSLLEKG